MNKEHEKMMADLQRLLKTQKFESAADAKKFMDSLIGQKIPSLPEEALTLEQQAQNLVFEAYELAPHKAKQKIEEALQLDRDCIEAYEYLGTMEDTAEIASVFYEKGISIGRRIFGGEYWESHIGSFWGFHETRPFMRCMLQYAHCLYTMGEVEACVAVQEEMIVLNPTDNQGVRDQLLLYLIELDENEKFERYANMYEDTFMAFPLFNRALFAFKTEGESENANQQLQKALQQNKFVAGKLLSKKPITDVVGHYSPGDESEATYYADFAQHIWQNTKGALLWLKKHAGK